MAKSFGLQKEFYVERGTSYRGDDGDLITDRNCFSLTNKINIDSLNNSSRTMSDFKDNNIMGFAGINFFDGKILAFSDSKSECKDGKKIFGNEYFISVFCGINSVVSDKYGISELKYLQTILDKTISEANCTTPEKLAVRLCRAVRSLSAFEDIKIRMVAASHIPGGVRFVESFVSDREYNLKQENYYGASVKAYYCGDNEYVNYINYHNDALEMNDPDELRKKLEQIQNKIDQTHLPGWERKVDGPFIVKEF